jgi:uncharacterized protein (TIGR03437 family)
LGAGKLSAGAAASAAITANPVNLSFGAIGSASLPITKQLNITNAGASPANLTFAVANGTSSGLSPSLNTPSLSIAAGATGTVAVTLSGSVPRAGEYSGAVTIQGQSVSLRVPYMYIVGNGTAANITPLIGDFNDGTVNQMIPDGGVAFKITDQHGLPVTGLAVSFRARQGGAVSQASTKTDQYGIASAVATLGSQPGTYTFVGSGGGLSYTFTDFARLQPQIAGIASAAGTATTVAPGSYVSIYGTGLSDTTDFTPSAALPLAIDLVNVSFDVPSANISVPGHLLYVSPGQVNVQVPWELQGQSSALVKVTIDQSFGNVVTLPLSDSVPALYEFSPGVVAAQDASFSAINASNPAKRGQTITVYANGLGPVSNQPPTGAVAQSSPLSQTTATPTVTIGGQQAMVAFSGLTPGYAALYQLNVVVPTNLSAGNDPITVSIGGKTANQSSISVQ